jgi:hypothetical protein
MRRLVDWTFGQIKHMCPPWVGWLYVEWKWNLGFGIYTVGPGIHVRFILHLLIVHAGLQVRLKQPKVPVFFVREGKEKSE